MSASVHKIANRVWVHDVHGNFVFVDHGELTATVFANTWDPWHIALHDKKRGALLVRCASFNTPFEAMKMAGQILDGEPCSLQPMLDALPEG